MTELLTAAQMRAVEEAAIASGEVTGLELMERAGRGVADAVFAEWPELLAAGALPRTPGYLGNEEEPKPLRAVVLCGPGNNGGDGFVVARLLKERGWEVEVFLYGDPERMPPDARVNYERWVGMGEVRDFHDLENPPGSFGFDLVVDALFGIGLSRPLEASLDYLFPEGDLRGASGLAKVVCVDVPSGLCADSGRDLEGRAVLADLTVTFHRAKVGHMIGDGPENCGRLAVMDIGLNARRPMRFNATASAGRILCPPGSRPPDLDPECRLVTFAGGLAKGSSAHKYAHGHALVLSGPSGRGGAGRMAARGALRIGTGLVTLGCPPEAVAENAARLDAVMLRPVADAAALADALEDARINALCLGPGMGVGGREAGLVAAALTSARATVLDADALTLLAQHPDLFAALHARCVLTPHAGEFARLFPDIAERLAGPATKGPAYSKVDATREAARRAGCVVLYKGADTVIADPSGRCSINSAQYDRAAPWLATAGSGDVLSGFIVGLMARGFDPKSAAETAAWLHVECARKFGPGLIAEDLPEQLPAVFRDLEIQA